MIIGLLNRVRREDDTLNVEDEDVENEEKIKPKWLKIVVTLLIGTWILMYFSLNYETVLYKSVSITVPVTLKMYKSFCS